MGSGFSRIIPAFVFATVYLFGYLLATPVAHAAGVPGGNITDPVVRGVDIAKPAVVRIIGILDGRLTVEIATTTTHCDCLHFHVLEAPIKLPYFGSGAFISAHGDILTADHIVQPPHDASLDQALYATAAQDVADYINAHFNVSVPFTANDVYSALANGTFRSQPRMVYPLP